MLWLLNDEREELHRRGGEGRGREGERGLRGGGGLVWVSSARPCKINTYTYRYTYIYTYT
jgi:hypothetical protein